LPLNWSVKGWSVEGCLSLLRNINDGDFIFQANYSSNHHHSAAAAAATIAQEKHSPPSQ